MKTINFTILFSFFLCLFKLKQKYFLRCCGRQFVFLLVLFSGVFYNLVLALDFSQLETVISELEQRFPPADRQSWLVIVADQPLHFSPTNISTTNISPEKSLSETTTSQTKEQDVSAAEKKEIANVLSKPSSLIIRRHLNKSALQELPSVRKTTTIRQEAAHQGVLFANNFSDRQKENNFWASEEIIYQESKQVMLEKIQAIREKYDKLGASSDQTFKNRRRPKNQGR